MIWAVAALCACEDLSEGDRETINIVIPADHGIFLGRYDSGKSRLRFTTFVDSKQLWDEELYALKELTTLGEENLALSALDIVAKGWIAHDSTHISGRLIDIWRSFGWVIQEREDRPSRFDAAWASVTNVRQ